MAYAGGLDLTPQAEPVHPLPVREKRSTGILVSRVYPSQKIIAVDPRGELRGGIEGLHPLRGYEESASIRVRKIRQRPDDRYQMHQALIGRRSRTSPARGRIRCTYDRGRTLEHQTPTPT